jgi:hypothetical protein
MINAIKNLIAALRSKRPEPEYAAKKFGKHTLYVLKIKN